MKHTCSLLAGVALAAMLAGTARAQSVSIAVTDLSTEGVEGSEGRVLSEQFRYELSFTGTVGKAGEYTIVNADDVARQQTDYSGYRTAPESVAPAVS